MRFEIFIHSKGGSAPDRISAEQAIPIPTRGEALVYSPAGSGGTVVTRIVKTRRFIYSNLPEVLTVHLEVED
jgi:hypothetical protein